MSANSNGWYKGDVTVNITADGTNEIRAYTIDRAGNESSTYGSKTVNKDIQVPTITHVSYTPASSTTISANIEGNDGTGSGIHHYQFYLNDIDKGTSTTTTTTLSADMGQYTAKIRTEIVNGAVRFYGVMLLNEDCLQLNH